MCFLHLLDSNWAQKPIHELWTLLCDILHINVDKYDILGTVRVKIVYRMRIFRNTRRNAFTCVVFDMELEFFKI